MAGWGGGVDKGIMSYCLIITVWILLIKNKNFEHENYMLIVFLLIEAWAWWHKLCKVLSMKQLQQAKHIQYEYNIKRKAFYKLDQPVSKVH